MNPTYTCPVELYIRNAQCQPHLRDHYLGRLDTLEHDVAIHTLRRPVVTAQTQDTSRSSIPEGHTKDGSMPSVLEGQNKSGASFPAQSELSNQENSMKRKVNMVIIVDIMIA